MKTKEINILSYIFVIIVAVLIKEFVFSPIKVQGTSMEPNLQDGDIMILNEIGYHLNGLERFDIVVVRTDEGKIIKRVVGFPGDTIKYQDNKLYINGNLIEEEFSHDVTHNFDLNEIGHDKIPDGYYFVIGDNRGNSLDSRKIGLIKKQQIMGKTDFVVYPFAKFGKIK